MKLISRNRQGFALPEFMALAAISRAIRPYARAPRFALALILPSWDKKGSYLRAAAAILNPDANFRISDRVYIGGEKPESYDAVLDELGNKKTLILFESEDQIPVEFAVAFDAVIHVAAPTSRQIQGLVKWAYRVDVTSEQADVLGRSDWRRLKLAVMRGRPISRVLAMLEKMDASAPVAVVRMPDAIEDVLLEDMEGYGAAKLWGLELARDIADWGSASLAWDDVDRGIMLSGPPGVGKTIFARALAATCKIELVVASYAKWQAKGHLGDFLKAMQKSFDEARRKAPAILFIDELDAFGDRNTVAGDNASYDIKATNGLLEQLDGLQGREGVVVVGACNNPDLIDPAIYRPGRLDRHVRIPFPDVKARAAIFRMHLRGKLTDHDHREFANATEGLVGAGIQLIVRDARRRARRKRRDIAAEDVIAELPATVQMPHEVVRVNAIHEIGHAVVGSVLGLELADVSISPALRVEPQSRIVGRAKFIRDPWARRTKEHYLNIIAMTMGGMAAEQLFLGSHDDGAAGGEGADLYEATKIAISMERSFGMGQKLGSYGHPSDRHTNGITYLDPALLGQVDEVLREQLVRATGILERHRHACLKLAEELIERLELPGQEVLDALEKGEGDDQQEPIPQRC